MKKTNKKKLEEFIRVDHAGERGAIKIYEGQLLALKTFKKDPELLKLIEEMREHEQEHSDFFENEIRERNIKPTKFLPLWDLLGLGLGFGSTLLGKKAAMLCTASVEEVIDGHYKSQLHKLGDDEKSLKKYVNPILKKLEENNCVVYADKKVRKIFKGKSKKATRKNWSKEYLDSKVSVKSVKI